MEYFHPKNDFLLSLSYSWIFTDLWVSDEKMIYQTIQDVLYASGLELSFLHSLWVYNCTTSSFHYFVFPEYASGELMHSPTLSPCGEFQILKLMLNCYWRWICQDLKCRKLSTWRKKTFLSHQMNNLNPRLHELTTKLVSIFIQNGLLVLLPSEWNIHDPSPEFVSSCDKSLTRAICRNLAGRQKHWGQLELPRNSKSPCLPKLYPKVAS